MTDLAQQAMSLRDNEAFQTSLTNIKAAALDKLAVIDADDKNGILKAQATVQVVDAIRDDIDAFIRAGIPRGAPGIA
jgi:hypothetical protein